MQGLYEFIRTFWVVWLLLIFVAIVAWAFWPGRKRQLEEHGRIPLKDDDEKDT
ncbi:MAG: cbb3-type cytochrome c oxidase subunit 3 [Azospirillaceae bacterium]